MKKKNIIFLVVLVLFSMLVFPTKLYALSGYDFKLEYTGDIIINQEKNANVLLVGTNGTAYPKVRIKVDITGPETPKIMATDTAGNQIDIAKEGYWGPPTGFAVQGDFTNTTPIKATFTKHGTYSIRLSLIDLDNANQVITSKTIQVLVLSDVVEEKPVEKLPQTGTTIVDYIAYGVLVLSIVIIFTVVMKMVRNKHSINGTHE